MRVARRLLCCLFLLLLWRLFLLLLCCCVVTVVCECWCADVWQVGMWICVKRALEWTEVAIRVVLVMSVVLNTDMETWRHETCDSGYIHRIILHHITRDHMTFHGMTSCIPFHVTSCRLLPSACCPSVVVAHRALCCVV